MFSVAASYADWEGGIVGHAALAGATNPPPAKLPKIAQLRWFFAHASVGGNMIEGLEELCAGDAVRFPLRTFEVAPAGSEGGADYRASSEPSATSAGFVYECMRGNPGWRNKLVCFSNSVVFSGWRYPKVNLVMDKFCWIDPDADPAEYCARMSGLEARFPQTLFVYATMPLTTETAGSENDQRNQFNRQVRAHCRTAGKWLLDIADIEAWSEAGTEQTYASGGATNQRMAAAYAVDAGGSDFHLNAIGRRRGALGWYALALALFDADRDSDGVSDGDELLAGTNPVSSEVCDGVDNDGDGQIDEDCRNSASCFSGNQTIRCAGAGWSRAFVMDLTNFRNIAVQDGYQSYTVNYLLYYNIWTGIYLYGYDSGRFVAVNWAIDLDL